VLSAVLNGATQQAVYPAEYVVDRFCPLLLSTFFASPCLRTRGISFLSMPSFWRICSDRRGALLDFTSATTFPSALAMSARERRARRPFVFRAGVAALVGFGALAFLVEPLGRPGPRRGAPSEAWV